MLFKYLFQAMTTNCELQVIHGNKKTADFAASTVLREVKRLEKKYNFHSPTSYLSQKINNRENDTLVLDEETATLLNRVFNLSKECNDIFDITVGTFSDCYKKKTIQEYNKCIEALKHYTGRTTFILEGNTLTFTNSFTKFDLGGVVKEYSIDVSKEILQKSSIFSALINYGGDIYALGVKEDGTKWKVGIKNPSNPKLNIKSIELSNKALTTSAHYERKRKIGKKEVSHIIPSKNAASSSLIQSTVISDSVLESGIYSTSFLIDERINVRKGIEVFNIQKGLKIIT
ncbi:MAG: FAD:protein FMN transferase [Nitrospinae bacterium]|nr:FAD:protein FMN transferase [Nitrospinota bacterium]